MATLIQRCNRNVKFATFFRRWYYDIAPRLCQRSGEHQMWTIHGHMVTFPQPYLKVVKKLNNNMIFVWYAELIL